jgi:carbamoylphosphate synthase large subunit
VAEEVGYPVVIRPAYTMGGTGGGHVYNVEELRVAGPGHAASLVGQVLVEESVIGWEELELEVVRDAKQPDDHGLLYRKRGCHGRAYRRFLLHRAHAHH